MNKFVVFLLLLLNCTVLTATAQDSLSVQIDSTQRVQKKFASDLSEKYTGTDFDYDSVEGQSQNLIARAVAWFFQQIEKIFGVELSPEVYAILEFLIYGIFAILILYFLIKLLLGQKASSFFRGEISKMAPLNVQEEHIERINLDELIKQALKQKDYRLAVRYMYLKSLQQLSQHGLIIWHFDKTNQDYHREIENPGLKSNFKQISYLYEYVWYGEFVLDESRFNKAQKDFRTFNQTLSNAG